VAYREPPLFDTDRDRQGWCPRRRRALRRRRTRGLVA